MVLRKNNINLITKGRLTKLVTLVLFLVLILLPASAFAQEKEVTLSHMRVSIWPEYDQPRVLSIYEGQLVDKNAVPAKIKFLLPKDAEVNQACALTENGEHVCQVYETNIEGDFKAVTYTIPHPTFYIDFYYNPLGKGENKNFDYLFKAPYSVDKLELEVQQPLKATNFKVTPAAMSEGLDQKGFKYARYSYGTVSPGQDFKLGISYVKSDPKPSVEELPQGGTAQGQAGSGQGGAFTFSPLVIFLSITASVLFALVGYIIVTARGGGRIMRPAYSHTGSGRSKKDTSRSKGKGKNTGVQMHTAKFCTNCGFQAEAGDKFCSKCGKKIKR